MLGTELPPLPGKALDYYFQGGRYPLNKIKETDKKFHEYLSKKVNWHALLYIMCTIVCIDECMKTN